MLLYEKYRPKTLSAVIGQPSAIKQIQRYIDRDSLANAIYWIRGKSGIGKTTIARIISGLIAPLDTIELDGQDVNLEFIRDIENRFRSGPTLFVPQWVYIINEAHGLRSNIIQRLNTTFELQNIQKYTTWIFTTTRAGEKNLFDEEIEEIPFTSRVRKITLTDQGLCPLIAQWAHDIADIEGLNGQPIEAYIKLVKRNSNSFRAVLTAIEEGEMLP